MCYEESWFALPSFGKAFMIGPPLSRHVLLKMDCWDALQEMIKDNDGGLWMDFASRCHLACGAFGPTPFERALKCHTSIWRGWLAFVGAQAELEW